MSNEGKHSSIHDVDPVGSILFKVAGIQAFWDDLHSKVRVPNEFQWKLAGMQGLVQTEQRTLPYREILRDVLYAYDAEPLTPSIAGPKNTIIGKNCLHSPLMALLATPLWQHAVETGYQFIKTVENDKTVSTSRIWAYLIPIVAHDIGKLRRLRPSRYKSEQHPILGAIELDGIIGGRLPANIKEKLVNAVLNHHRLIRTLERSRQQIAIAVVVCDRMARGKESQFDFDNLIASVHRNDDTCYGHPE
ncbi:hypothetical protein [Geomonas agri]|uniref:hypothetical protein n=1 Tax=Geomonas agri TaxID=2873702 RepID=UPI001CD7FC19|nr:hypothetical protein [Geomonas agri]